MNDEQETKILAQKLSRYFKPHIQRALTAYAQNNSRASQVIRESGGHNKSAELASDDLARSFYNVTYNSIGAKNIHEPFIISFCGHLDEYEKENGLLSQWRAYGRDGGYAIAFDAKELWHQLLNEREKYAYYCVSLSDVVYDGDRVRFENEFKPLLDAIPEVIKKSFFNDLESKSVPFEDLFTPFAVSSARLKHFGFREEHEVRAILSPLSQKSISEFKPSEDPDRILEKLIKPIYSKPSLAQFLKVNEDSTDRLPIKYIIVGPDANKQGRAERLKKHLQLRNIEIEVKTSITPLL